MSTRATRQLWTPQQQLADLQRRLLDLETRVPAHPEPWHEVGAAGEPAFSNGWVNYGGTTGAPAGFVRRNGIVFMRGLIKDGTTLLEFFVLPVGHRPADKSSFWLETSNGENNRITVNSDGVVSGTGALATWLYLDGINFRVAGS